MIRTLVVAAYPTVRAGLAAVLRAEPGMEIVGEAANADSLLALTASLQPDVILMELETGQEELATSLWQLTETTPGSGIVLLCDANERWAIDALRAGVRGVLGRDASGAEIVAAVTAAGLGLVIMHPSTMRTLLPLEAAQAPISAALATTEMLTPRESEVLRLLSEGLGNKIISRRLGISEHTVKFHVGAIMTKLGAASRTEAVTLAARRGLIML